MRQRVVDQVHIMIQLHVCACLTWRNGQRQVLIAHAHAHHVRAAAFQKARRSQSLQGNHYDFITAILLTD
jgi:hypothetical protein